MAIAALNSILGKYSGRHQSQQKRRRDDVRHVTKSAGKEGVKQDNCEFGVRQLCARACGWCGVTRGGAYENGRDVGGVISGADGQVNSISKEGTYQRES